MRPAWVMARPDLLQRCLLGRVCCMQLQPKWCRATFDMSGHFGCKAKPGRRCDGGNLRAAAN
eukprot:9068312-Alexandrium_andersonii.AAC.1